jgi:hypothetical protein
MWPGVGWLMCLLALGADPAPTTRPGSAGGAQPAPNAKPAPPNRPAVAPATAAKAGAAAEGPGTNASAPAPGGGLTGSLDSAHRRELDDIHRQDMATALARHNILIDWHEHKLAELVDWRDRVEVASLIGVEHDLQLDWRTMSLADLNDIRLRASKSAELAGAFGVTIDWRLYSWRQLEELRRAVAKIQASEVPNTADGKGRKQRSAPGQAKPTSPATTATGTRPDRNAVTDI